MSKVTKAAAVGYYITCRRPRSSVRLNKRQPASSFVSHSSIATVIVQLRNNKLQYGKDSPPIDAITTLMIKFIIRDA